MTPDEEDALVFETARRCGAVYEYAAIRLAIRATVAAERERAARAAINMAQGMATNDLDDGYNTAENEIAAAIRKGE